MKKLIVLIVCITMVMSLILSNSSVAATKTTPAKKVVTLKVYSMVSQKSGLQQNYFMDYIKSKIGVQVDLIPTGNDATQKLQALMAGGELPDVVVFQDKQKQVEDAIKAKLLLNLDANLSKLPDVVKNASASLKYYRNNVSAGTNKAYAIPGFVGSNQDPVNSNIGPTLRWDLYKKLGMPKLKTMEDYLPLLKKMQDLEPVNADGQKVYGFTLWTDWDSASNSVYQALQFGMMAGYHTEMSVTLPFAELDRSNNIVGTLDAKSQYMRGIKLLFKANQMGLVDPDSVTQKFEQALAKAGQGRVLFSYWPWLAGAYNTKERDAMTQPVGYAPVYTDESRIFLNDTKSSVGTSYAWAIGADTKKKDAALSLINLFYNDEANMVMFNGPKGLIWDLDSKGKPYVTAKGWDYLDNGKVLPGGGKLGPLNNNESGAASIQCFGLSSMFISEKYKVPYNYLAWTTSQGHGSTNLQKDWAKAYGSKNVVQYAYNKKKNASLPTQGTYIGSKTDEVTSLVPQIGSVVTANSWKMIFAKDQAEFDSIYKDMVTKANGLGLAKVLAWDKTAWNKAKATATKYK